MDEIHLKVGGRGYNVHVALIRVQVVKREFLPGEK